MPCRPSLRPAAILGTALALLLAPGWPGAMAQTAAPTPTGITVVGSAEVSAKPDMAQVQVGVVTEATRAANALEDNNRAMAKLRTLLAHRGLAGRNIQTVRFGITPRYQANAGAAARLVGYRVEHQLNLTVHRLQGLGTLLDALVQAGANEIANVRFSVADPRTLRDQARRLAMADARHRAALYAGAAGLSLGQVTSIIEQGTAGPRPLAFAADSLRAVPLAPGEISVRATVQVRFAARAR